MESHRATLRRLWTLFRERGANPVAIAMGRRMGWRAATALFVILECLALLTIVLYGHVDLFGVPRPSDAPFFSAFGCFLCAIGVAAATPLFFLFRMAAFDSREELEDLHRTLLRKDEVVFGVFWPIAGRQLLFLLPAWGAALAAGLHPKIVEQLGKAYVASAGSMACIAVGGWLIALTECVRVWLADGLATAWRVLLAWVRIAFRIGALAWFFVGATFLAADWVERFNALRFRIEGEWPFYPDALELGFVYAMLACAVCLLGLFIARQLRAMALRAGDRFFAAAVPEISVARVGALAEAALRASVDGRAFRREAFRRNLRPCLIAGAIVAALFFVLAAFMKYFHETGVWPAQFPRRWDGYGGSIAEDSPTLRHFFIHLFVSPFGIVAYALAALAVARRLGARVLLQSGNFLVSLLLLQGPHVVGLLLPWALFAVMAAAPLWPFRFRDDVVGVGVLMAGLSLLAIGAVALWSAWIAVEPNPARARRRLLVAIAGAGLLLLATKTFHVQFLTGRTEGQFIGSGLVLAAVLVELAFNSLPFWRQRFHERHTLTNPPGTILVFED